MNSQVLLLSLLASVAPLAADAIVSANWSACGTTESVSFQDSIANGYAVSRTCDYGANINGDASANSDDLSVHAYSHVNGDQTALNLSAEAFDTFEIKPPTPGLYTLSFELAGLIFRDAGNGFVYFSLSGRGLDDQWSQGGENHWLPIDTIFVSTPVMLKGSFKYTADVRAAAVGFPLDWGMGSADLQATFLGLEPVASGFGEAAVPEPGSWILLGSGLGGMLLVNLCRSAASLPRWLLAGEIRRP